MRTRIVSRGCCRCRLWTIARDRLCFPCALRASDGTNSDSEYSHHNAPRQCVSGSPMWHRRLVAIATVRRVYAVGKVDGRVKSYRPGISLKFKLTGQLEPGFSQNISTTKSSAEAR